MPRAPSSCRHTEPLSTKLLRYFSLLALLQLVGSSCDLFGLHIASTEIIVIIALLLLLDLLVVALDGIEPFFCEQQEFQEDLTALGLLKQT